MRLDIIDYGPLANEAGLRFQGGDVADAVWCLKCRRSETHSGLEEEAITLILRIVDTMALKVMADNAKGASDGGGE